MATRIPNFVAKLLSPKALVFIIKLYCHKNLTICENFVDTKICNTDE